MVDTDDAITNSVEIFDIAYNTNLEDTVEVISENTLKVIKNGRAFLVPREIAGRYEVDSILSASTGFGLILIAYDKKLFGKKVLIKATNYKGKIARNNLDSKNMIVKRRKEIEYEKNVLIQLQKLGIPNVPALCGYEIGYCPSIAWPEGIIDSKKRFLTDEAFEEPYIILQYIEGTTLNDYVQSNKIDKESPQWQYKVLKLTKQLLKVFEVMQKGNSNGAKFIYQDLKPQNVIISPNNTFTLIDFGATAIVYNGQIINRGIGTPGYMAPEVKDRNLPFDGRVDIYSMGVMMYDLLNNTGILNFVTEKGLVDNLSFNNLRVDESIKSIILTATRMNPDDRYQSARDMLKDIFSSMKKISKDYKIISDEGNEW